MSNDDKIPQPHVQVNLFRQHPSGSTGIYIRMKPEDKRLVDRAAHHLGLTSMAFCRLVLINASQEVLETFGPRVNDELRTEEEG